MKKSLTMMLTVLRSMYEHVSSLGNGWYLVGTHPEVHRYQVWGVYSSRAKKVMCWGDKYEKLSPALISFEKIRTGLGGSSSTDHHLFSLRKGRLVKFGDYSGSGFQLCQNSHYVRGYFLKFVQAGNGVKVVGGCGIFDLENERFVIQPQYDKLISLGEGQYYGITKDRVTGKEAYFLIRIDEKGKAITQKTNKIA
jgi:hypothetical protein